MWRSAVALAPEAAPATTARPAAAALRHGDSAASTRRRASVIARADGVRRSKQYVARKELQKRARQEYLRRIYETADRVEEDHLVFELQPSSPRVRSELQEADQHAALNRQLAQQIPTLSSAQALQAFVQEHGDRLNFLNVVALVTCAATVLQQEYTAAASSSGGQPAASGSSSSADSTAAAAAPAAASPPAADPAALVTQLAVLVLQRSSWFQPPHFAATAVALCDLGVADVAVWDNLTAAAEHKVGAFTFPQLAATLEALAAAGYTPALSWVERTYRQASRHLHAADPADMAVLLGAWGEMGYTPRDRLFLNQVKTSTRRAFDQQQLSAAELVQLMHGLARMPRYAPNHGWLAALAKATQPQLQALTPGALLDLLLSFVALDFRPPEQCMDAVLARLQDSMQDLLLVEQQQQAGGGSATDSSSSSEPWPQEQQLLFLPPLDLQQLAQQQQLQAPGVLLATGLGAEVAEGAEQQLPRLVGPSEVQQLQALFDEADDSASDSSTEQLQQQQPQHAEAAAANAPTARLSSGNSSSEALSLRRQLLQPQLEPEHLGVLCWCLGRLQYQPSGDCMQLLGRVLLAAGSKGSAGLPQQVLVDVLQGCVAAGYLPVGALQQQLLGAVLQSVPTMPAECLRRTCQALTGLELGLQQYAQHPAALLMLRPPTWQQQQPGAVAGAAALDPGSIAEPLQQLKQQTAAAIIQRQGAVLASSNTAQLADVLAFAAAAGQAPSLDYMTAAVARAVNKLPDGCPTPAVCTLVWALARMGFKPHPQLLHQLLAVLQKGLHLLSSQDLAHAGWALCTLRHRPGNTWLSLYLREVAAKAPYMSPQGLTDTLWALACFAARPDREWLKQVVQAAGSLAAARSLSRRNAAVTVWALQQLGVQPQLMGFTAGSAGSEAQGSVQRALLSLAQLVQA